MTEIDKKITRLESIRDRLELIPEPVNNFTASVSMKSKQDVFVVHGYDNEA